MRRKFTLLLMVAAGLTVTPVLHAEDDSTTVVSEGETPEDAATAITLPENAGAQAPERAASGLETANAARELKGNETAAGARELGRELGERTADLSPSVGMRATTPTSTATVTRTIKY